MADMLYTISEVSLTDSEQPLLQTGEQVLQNGEIGTQEAGMENTLLEEEFEEELIIEDFSIDGICGVY